MTNLAVPLAIATPFLVGVISFFQPRAVFRPVATLLVFVTAFSALQLAVDVRTSGVLHYYIGGWRAPLGINLRVDGLAALMLLLTSAIVIAVGLYASEYFRDENGADGEARRGFWPLCFFLWGSLNTFFLVGDIFTIYVCLELITLAAVAAICLSTEASALKAALRYLMAALVGSIGYLAGVAIIYAQTNSLDMGQIPSRIEYGWNVWTALSLMTAGLAVKTALFPLHFWLPGAHSSAPAPVSALLSGLVVKAAFYVVIRLWVEVFPLATSLSATHVLGVLGVGAIIWGSIQAIVQERIKLMIAYSTVAQIGYLFLAFPLLKAATRGSSQMRNDVWEGTAYFVLSHGVAKAALFLVIGSFARVSGSDRLYDLNGVAGQIPVATLVWGLAGISLIGLPPSGGFIAKWLLLTAAIEGGQWLYASVILIGGLLASVYIFRVLWHAFQSPEAGREVKEAEIIPGLLSIAMLMLGVLIVFMGLRAKEVLALLQIGSPFQEGPMP